MRLILDIQTIQSTLAGERGLARYVTHLALELLKRPGLVSGLHLNPTRPFPKNLHLDLLYSDRLSWGGAAAIREAAREGNPAYWIMSPFEEEAKYDTLLPRTVVAANGILIVTLFDLIPFLQPETYLTSPRKRAHYINCLDIVKMADLVLCISSHTRDDALKHLGLEPEKTAVIGAGVSAFFHPAANFDPDIRALQGLFPRLRRPFVLSLLGNDERKNVEGLIEAYSRLPRAVRSSHCLVIAGKFWPGIPEKVLASCSPEIAESVFFTGYVPDSELRALYRCCALFVFPSKYEGFGLPLAEAMACGAPSIASRSSSLTAQLEDDRALFDPEDPSDLAACMERALTGTETIRGLRELALRKGGEHRWEEVAARSVRAIETLAGQSRSRPGRMCRPARPSIALVGPFPPQRSGVADYNFAMARELARLTDLFLFYCGDCDVAALRALGPAACRPVGDLGRHVSPQYLDAVIYTFGNSPHHVATLDKILEYPGVLWLHDVHVLDLYKAYALQLGLSVQSYLTETARAIYADRSPPPATGIDPFGIAALKSWGLHFTSEIVSGSRGVIVSSRHALSMLELDQNPGSPKPRSLVLPLACGRHSGNGCATAGTPPDPPVVSTFGFLGEAKAPDLLIEAVSKLPSHLHARLNLVGYADPDYHEFLLSHARELGIADSVRITGYLTKSEWFDHIRGTSCAVQLRHNSNGESSGTVADCLGLGAPVISNMASCRDMPADTVVHVSREVSVDELRDCILSVLTDAARWRRLHEGGLRYAAANSFPITAGRLIGAAMELSR